MRRALIGLAAALVLCGAAWLASCAASEPAGYPDPEREVRHIIPWRAGGSTDSAMRGFVSYLETHLGARVITENVPGGLSSVGLTMAKRAQPDGYTLATLTYDVLSVELLGLAPLSWRSFEPVCVVTDHPSALIVPAQRWPDLAAFQAEGRTAPGSILVGNVGTRGIWHQHAAAMENALDVQLRHIPYEGGSGPQLAAILGGEVDAIVSSLPAAMPYVEAGTLRVLAVMAAERSPLVPDAPTFRELGHDLEFGGFRILAAPGGTPEAVLATLEAACRATAEDPRYIAWAQGAAIGAAWRDRAGARAYLEELAPRVRRLMAEMEGP